LCNLQHRGALGAEPNTGDGAGILLQMPDRFLREVVPFDLPREGHYASGIAFLPSDPGEADRAADRVGALGTAEGPGGLGWREVPPDPSGLGSRGLSTMPPFRQLFIAGDGLADITLDRHAYVVRKRIEHEITGDDGDGLVYFPSLSARTLVYKGMLTTPQLSEFYPDLNDERIESALALVHSR